MDFGKTEEQELLVSNLIDLIQREVPESYLQEIDRKHEFPHKAWRALADNGFLRLGIPAEYGGTPCDTQTLVMLGETLGQHAYDVGVVFGLGIITVRDIAQFGNEAQKREVLGGFVKGGLPAALGISEPLAGSDASNIKTTAALDGDTWFINGQKTYCTMANVADHILLTARDPSVESPYKGMHMLLLPTNTPGVRITPLQQMGWWTVPACEVLLDDVRLPKEALVGQPYNGWLQLMANFEIERLILAAVSVGAAQGAFDDAVAYANQRTQFGKPIGSFQMIQQKLVDMAAKIENMRNGAYKIAWMMDKGMPVRKEHAVFKRYTGTASQEVIDDALQIMGGMGIMMDHRVQRVWRGNRILRIGAGTDEIMVNIAGPQYLAAYR